MSLTLNQILFLVITLTFVVAVTFLVSLFIQLKKTAREGENTLKEIQSLVKDLKETSHMVQKKMDECGEMMENAKKTAAGLSDIVVFLSTKLIRPSSKFWPILFPLMRFGWRHAKKKKEEKHGK